MIEVLAFLSLYVYVCCCLENLNSFFAKRLILLCAYLRMSLLLGIKDVICLMNNVERSNGGSPIYHLSSFRCFKLILVPV